MHPIFFTEIKLANLKSLLFIWFKALRRGKKVCKKYNKISVTECVKEVNIWRRLAPNSLQVAFQTIMGQWEGWSDWCREILLNIKMKINCFQNAFPEIKICFHCLSLRTMLRSWIFCHSNIFGESDFHINYPRSTIWSDIVSQTKASVTFEQP